MDDEDSERVWHGMDLLTPSPIHKPLLYSTPGDVPVTSQSTEYKVVHVVSATTSSTIIKESALIEGSAASLGVKVSSKRQDIHNGEPYFYIQSIKVVQGHWMSVHLWRKRDDVKAAIYLVVSYRCLL